ncbi:MAG: PilW family protein [Pirellulales bacterium]
MTRRNRAVSRQSSAFRQRRVRAFTLVEMLIAMAITLVMIGAVVTLFANISNSVRNRRAVIELSGQMRHARNMLQQDLQGATCNGLVWQRPDENQGYIEIIEGPHREAQASDLVDGRENTTVGANYNPEIDHKTSIIPASNVPFADSTWLTDGGSLGDYDDILLLTVRNEHEPFVGRAPLTNGSARAVRPNQTDANLMPAWEPATITSPLAEVVWYAVENPEEAVNDDAGRFFGEPGMRTIYRRTLLVAPFINPYRYVNPNTGEVVDTFQINGTGPTFTAQPGLVRILPASVQQDEVAEALSCLVAFQERFDLSVRLEFDPLLDAPNGRWKIVANTLGDLTKRENRYEHHFFAPNSDPPRRQFPFAMVAAGSDYEGNEVRVVLDPEIQNASGGPSPFRAGRAILTSRPAIKGYPGIDDYVANFRIDPTATQGKVFQNRPFAYINDRSSSLATARVMLNDDGEIVRIVAGPVPLSGERRGEDVMLSDALGFDLRVYDPGAPLFAHAATETVLQPTDPAWLDAYVSNDNMTNSNASPGRIGNGNSASQPTFLFVGQGAFVDLGYGFDLRRIYWSNAEPAELPEPQFNNAFSSATKPWFFANRPLSDVYGNQLATGYAVFDTWSLHYENNGINEDNDATVTATGAWVRPYDSTNASLRPSIDEATNGLDDSGNYWEPNSSPPPSLVLVNAVRLGPDDVGERETTPPYDKPLRAIQAVLRLYERDSRQVRQVSINQSLVPE